MRIQFCLIGLLITYSFSRTPKRHDFRMSHTLGDQRLNHSIKDLVLLRGYLEPSYTFLRRLVGALTYPNAPSHSGKEALSLLPKQQQGHCKKPVLSFPNQVVFYSSKLCLNFFFKTSRFLTLEYLTKSLFSIIPEIILDFRFQVPTG